MPASFGDPYNRSLHLADLAGGCDDHRCSYAPIFYNPFEGLSMRTVPRGLNQRRKGLPPDSVLTGDA
jgi:hypothetical protein